MSNHLSRRTFVKAIGVAGVGYWAQSSGIANAISPNEKLNLAFIGLGHQGKANLSQFLDQNIVAVCDVDQGYMMDEVKKLLPKNPGAQKVLDIASDRRFEDFRVMFDKMDKEIDAVVISTPDHLHYHTGWESMKRGKHAYIEKPLAHNVWETRQLTNLAREKKLATQMGVKRHAFPSVRKGVEIARSGALGTIKEVYSWTNSSRGGPGRKPSAPPTKQLNWDLWLGPTESVPYRPGIAHYDFRFWWKYGSGETGNNGCHVLDIPYYALDLKYPTKVTCVPSDEKPHAENSPTKMYTKLEYPANNKRPGVTVHWVQGRPEKLDEVFSNYKLSEKQIAMINASGSQRINTMFVGDKAILFCGYEGSSPTILIPIEKGSSPVADVKGDGSLGKSPGFYNEWIDAVKGGPAATCNLDYSGPLTEAVLLSNIAYRIQGSFNWNAEEMEADNSAVTQYIRESYRKGWEV